MKIHNPNSLPTIDYRTVQPLQGDLKDLTEKNYNKLKRVLEKRGFTTPLFLWLEQKNVDGQVIQNYWLIDGHQRQRVMTKEDMNDDGDYKVPYILIEADNAQDAKAQLLEISSQYGTITQEGFDEFIADLPEQELYEVINFDALPLLGTTPDEEPEEDEAPEVDETVPSISKAGEIYQLGRHRLMCGNSTDLGMVSDLMDGELADLLFTDPPYNVDYDYGKKYSDGRAIKYEPIFNDKLTPEQYTEFLYQVFSNAYMVTKDEAPFYVWHSDKMRRENLSALEKAGWYISQPIVWVKNMHVLAISQDFQRKYEPALYGWKKGNKHYRNNDKAGMTDVWQVNKDPVKEYQHPTQKPVTLATMAIEKSLPEDGLVLELFGGSGSTLMGCEQRKARCYAMELDPKFCDVIRQRWFKFTNGTLDGWEEGTPVVNQVATETVDNQE